MELDIRVCVERSVVDYKDESEHSSSWVKWMRGGTGRVKRGDYLLWVTTRY
jgi:hypothetical protein